MSVTQISIGIDVGGTHTDLAAVSGDRVVRAKAPTTHHNYSIGIFDALKGVAEKLDLTVDSILANHCRAFVNGNTIVTNALTEMKGARVGVLVTAGFADVLRVGRGARLNVRDDHLQRNLPRVVPQELVMEIDERIDRDGNVVVPLNHTQVEQAVHRLRDRGVDCIAVCFLWSTANGQHEMEAQEIVHRHAPGVFVTRSVAVASVFREFERWQTAILNCYVQPPVKNFVETLAAGLRQRGYQRELEFFNGLGGVLTAEVVKEVPIQLYSSGPAGGATASAALARRYSLTEVLCGDMGGTSFDTILIQDYAPKVVQRCTIGRFDTALSLLDIDSIGAGGGSIVHLDSRGVPQVGPQSAGSNPGPVCAGRGGTQPTVTDCMAVMGFIDPKNYLGGGFELDVEAARAALEREVGAALGWDALKTAAGAYSLVVANMANALRAASISRGRDPRRCTFIAYGGALPVFSASICRRLGISDMIVPGHSSAFSAYGLLEADYIRRASATIGWILGDEAGYGHMIATRDRLEQEVRDDLRQAGFDAASVRIAHGGDFRYVGQLAELYQPMERSAVEQALGAAIIPAFNAAYEVEFGPDTAWRESKLMLVNYVVTGTGIRDKPDIKPLPVEPRDVTIALMSRRRLYLPDEQEWIETPIYDAAKLLPGAELAGPAIIDCRDTTIYVPTAARLRRDEYDNFRIAV
ncbi:MAG: hydantoinase/oxoprolinase family protein [Porticoccaceae bacterium]